jgi:AraC-like DNA-binding protein
MSTLISTDQVPAAERLDFVRAVVSECIAPIEFQPADPARFRVELRFGDLGAVRVMRLTATAYRALRTPALIRRSASDLLSLSMALSGHGILSQFGRVAHAGPGGFGLHDLNHPYNIVSVDPLSALQLTFPRTLLPLPASQLERLAAVPIGPDPGIGSLTSQLLTQLAAGMDHYTPAEAARLSTAALEVLATRLAHELDGDNWVPPESHKRATLVRIHAFIQQHLSDPELSPGVIAAANYVSTRTLHKLFQEQGETVAGWIRRRRLEAARRDLCDPSLCSRPAAATAARWGFSGASSFTRTFKAAYGMPPDAYRQHALTGGGEGCAQRKASGAQR